MTGQGITPLPIVPPPLHDERLSSWLARTADIYLVSTDDLLAHAGISQPLSQLEMGLGHSEIERLVGATAMPAGRLEDMTYKNCPAKYRGLVRLGSRDICPVCSAGMTRPPRFRSAAFAFAFWCQKHGVPLQGTDSSGIGTIGNEHLARRGAAFVRDWAMGAEKAAVSVDLTLELLLTPCRTPSPPEPWQLARLSPEKRRILALALSQARSRTVLGLVVPEYESAVAIYDRSLPKDLTGLCGASLAERYALAIGVARVMKNPAQTGARVWSGCDDFGRLRIEGRLSTRSTGHCMALAEAFGRSGNQTGTPQRRMSAANQKS